VGWTVVLRVPPSGSPQSTVTSAPIGTSGSTVASESARTHVSNVLSKLNLASRTQAALMAIREGLVPGPP
jgi:hypothetical protein